MDKILRASILQERTQPPANTCTVFWLSNKFLRYQRIPHFNLANVISEAEVYHSLATYFPSVSRNLIIELAVGLSHSQLPLTHSQLLFFVT